MALPLRPASPAPPPWRCSGVSSSPRASLLDTASKQNLPVGLPVNWVARFSLSVKLSASRLVRSLTDHTDFMSHGIHAADEHGHDLRSISNLQEVVFSCFGKACLFSSSIIYVLPPACLAEPCEQDYSLPNMPLLFAIAMVGATVGGASLQRQGKYKEAVKYHSMVLNISKMTGEDAGVTEAYGAIADCYTELGELEKAGEFYDKYIARLETD
ncbi:unnamed protein product [Urochloa humidicola]